MSQVQSGYTLTRPTQLPFEDAVARVRAELDAEGFTVLCEIDVQARLKKGLGAEREPYLIIGVWDPALAEIATEAQRRLSAVVDRVRN
jgi:uncharacterized protein (DUF302 family)